LRVGDRLEVNPVEVLDRPEVIPIETRAACVLEILRAFAHHSSNDPPGFQAVIGLIQE
jgi:hypothetical protein